MMRLRLLSLLLPLFVIVTSMGAAPCTLDRKVLLPYERGASATEEEWRDSRRAVMDFTYCEPEAIDRASRRVFFEVVRAEFETDHRPALDRWVARRPESEALFDGIRIFDHRLKELMDRIVTPADAEFAGTILSYGNARAIASLGPSVERDVIRQLGKPGRSYGLSRQYDAQLEALGTLGYWIDPANHSFSAVRKEMFTGILTSLLQTSDVVHSSAHARVLDAALRALAHSDDPAAGTAVRQWMEKQTDHAQPLYSAAGRAAEAIERNAAARQGH